MGQPAPPAVPAPPCLTPSQTSCTPQLDANGNVTFPGTVSIGTTLIDPVKGFGSYRIVTLPTPAAPVITPVGTGGGVTYTYVVTAVMPDSTETGQGLPGSTAAGNGTLSVSNYNAVATVAATNSKSCNIYRTAGGLTTGLIGNVACGATLNDTGLVGNTATPPSIPTTPPAGDMFVYFRAAPIRSLCFQSSVVNSEICLQGTVAGETAAEDEGFGWLVLQFLATGKWNTAMGSGSLYSVVSGNENTAYGADTLNKYLGSNNSAFGSHALSVATGTGNDAFGRNALPVVTSGTDNSAFGQSALLGCVTCVANTAFGTSSLAGLGTATADTYNVAFGKYALLTANNTSNNTAMGGRSLKDVTTGPRNTAVGFEAGVTATTANTLTTGTDNTYLGYRSGPGDATQHNFQTAIGDSAVASCDNCVVLGRSTDQVIATAGRISWGAGSEPSCITFTDLVIDGSLNTKVTSVSHNFVAGDVGAKLEVTAGTSWTVGTYYIVSTASNAATLNRSPGAVGLTAGTYILNRSMVVAVEAATDSLDTLRVCRKDASNAMAWTALY